MIDGNFLDELTVWYWLCQSFLQHQHLIINISNINMILNGVFSHLTVFICLNKLNEKEDCIDNVYSVGSIEKSVKCLFVSFQIR